MGRVFWGTMLAAIALIAMFVPMYPGPDSAYSLENVHAACASALVRLTSGQRCGNADFGWYLAIAALIAGIGLVTWGLTRD